ncbi:MAG: acetylornithine deacetylase [Pseudomonadota bacterium]
MPQLPDLKEMMEALIAEPSISSAESGLDHGNERVSALLANWCLDLGFDVEVQPVAGKPGHRNVIATAGRGPGGLILGGHSDTVPVDEKLWKSDPFRLVERDGRLYGLGTTDMKSYFALAFAAVQRCDLRNLKAPLTIIATADEETGMSGARALRDSAFRGAQAVIGEPTGSRPVRMHKGNTMHRIHLSGQSGHSSNPAFGNSALEGMHEVITELLAYRSELQQRYRNPGFAVPTPTLNLGCIHGGDNPNRICGACELSFDLRVLPGIDGTEIIDTLKRRVEGIAARRKLGVSIETIMALVPGLETPAGAAIVRAAERLTGFDAEAVAFTTEAPFYQQHGLDVVVMGPGDIGCAHQPDEHIRVDRLQPTIHHLTSLIQDFCVAPSVAPVHQRMNSR